MIAAAAGMAVVMGGLLWWKLGDAKPAEPLKIPPPSEAAASPILQNAPPPPPKPVEATKPVEEKQAKAPGPARPSVCGGTCSGSVTPALQSALRAKAGAGRSCYERALRQNAMLQGRMTIGVRVGPDGRVCGANVVSDALGDPSVASCVVRLMRAGTLPAPSGGCVDVQVPMSFVGKQ